MRGDPQVGTARLFALLPGRRWSSRSKPIDRRPRVTPEERIEIVARLEAEERAARRSGRSASDAWYMGRRW
jgi:hypothetical protein